MKKILFLVPVFILSSFLLSCGNFKLIKTNFDKKYIYKVYGSNHYLAWPASNDDLTRFKNSMKEKIMKSNLSKSDKQSQMDKIDNIIFAKGKYFIFQISGYNIVSPKNLQVKFNIYSQTNNITIKQILLLKTKVVEVNMEEDGIQIGSTKEYHESYREVYYNYEWLIMSNKGITKDNFKEPVFLDVVNPAGQKSIYKLVN